MNDVRHRRTSSCDSKDSNENKNVTIQGKIMYI